MRKWIPAFLILASLGFAALVLDRLPERVSPQWGVIIPWAEAAPSESLPRGVAAFGIPGLALVVWLLLRGLASPAGERVGHRLFPAWFVSPRTGAQAVERFGPTFDVIVAVVVAFLLLFHAVTLGTVLGWPTWTARLFAGLIGIGMFVVGNVMPRTRPNWVVGLRTRRTMADPDLWRRTHRWFGGLLMAAGMGVVAISLVSAPMAFLAAGVGSLASALVAATVANRGQSGESSTIGAVGFLVLLVSVTQAPTAAPATVAPDATSDVVAESFAGV